MAKRKFPKTAEAVATNGDVPTVSKFSRFAKKKSRLPELVWSVNAIRGNDELREHLNGIAKAYGVVHQIMLCPWQPDCVLVMSFINLNKADMIAKAITDKNAPAPELPEAS